MKKALFASLLALALALPASAAALPQPTLFLTTGGTGSSSKTAPSSPLYTVDPATGAATAVGDTGYAITGMSQDPTTGLLYAVSNFKSAGTPHTLLILNPATGAATAVGDTGEQGRIADIDFDSSGSLYGWSEEEDVPVSINKETGLATPLREHEISTYGSGNAFDLNDTWWLLGNGEGEAGGEEGEVWTLDPTTGVATERTRLIPIDENESSMSAASFDCARTTLYSTVNNFGEPPANLVTVDLATGALTNKGLTQTGADGLAWYCPLAFEINQAPATVGAKQKTTVTVPVVRGPRIKGSASVAYFTRNGSAEAGQDYKPVSGVLDFANNATRASIAVPITPDPKAGKARSFDVVLTAPSGGGSVAGTPYKITIKAGKPTVKVTGPFGKGRKPYLKLKSNQIPARFRCKIDKGKFKACGKSGKAPKQLKLSKLGPGKHTIAVQAINGAGLKSKKAKKSFSL